MFKKCDKNDDGSITFEEFKAGVKVPKFVTEDQLKAQFDKLDANADGTVSLVETCKFNIQKTVVFVE